MGSAYLQGADLAAFGVPGATPDQIEDASGAIDAYLQRPEGMVWAPDAAGWPCYMAALSPAFTLTSMGTITPGLNVVVPFTGGMANNDMIGEVLILDRSDGTKTEACVVSAVGTGTVTLQAVTRSHPPGPMDGGMVILEERSLPNGRSVTRVSRSPVARLIAGAGRYGYGRRSQQIAGQFAEMNILASVQAFGGPPQWIAFDVAQASVSPTTGEVWVPAGNLVATFADARLRYVAGYPFSGLPTPIKRATANVVTALQNFPELIGSIKTFQAGGTKIEKFADTLLDAETKARLGPFQASLFF